jgi:hypothetical protein
MAPLPTHSGLAARAGRVTGRRPQLPSGLRAASVTGPQRRRRRRLEQEKKVCAPAAGHSGIHLDRRYTRLAPTGSAFGQPAPPPDNAHAMLSCSFRSCVCLTVPGPCSHHGQFGQTT